MAIEKVFAIDGKPGPMGPALGRSPGDRRPGAVVEESHRPRSLVLRLDLGGIESRLRYGIEERDGHCEVRPDRAA